MRPTNKKSIGSMTSILSVFLFVVFLLSLVGVIIYYVDEAKSTINDGVIFHEDLSNFCVEAGQENFTNYNLVRPPYGCNYTFNFNKNKWVAQDEINMSNFGVWLDNREARTFFDEPTSTTYLFNAKTLTDIFIFFIFFIVMMHNLISAFGVEKISSFKIAMISIFGLPVFMISSYVVYLVANWFMGEVLTKTFTFYENTIFSDYPLFSWIYENFGYLMVVYGVLWFLALILNFKSLYDRLQHATGGQR